jgi:2-polyprenyl-6-hydroxyphenyl methylase/3-demethylubiquinone-9 3-methyltransferase
VNEEVNKFSKLAKDWWNKDKGVFNLLHKINDLRCSYINSVIKPYENPKILDIGCGGGILTEKLAECGYDICGVDPSKESIEQAILHSKFSNASYINTEIEQIDSKFDIILIMEVLEHVDDIESFLYTAIKLLHSGGMLFFSTINKTIKSFALAILMAEYVLRMLPRKTHDWNKFIKPSELYKILYSNGMAIKEMKGIELGILDSKWKITDDINVNYLGYALFRGSSL